ncbi:putative ubiquitin-protein ligase E3 Mdm2 [Lissonota sp. PSUC_FEM 10030012]|nr:putative ubiquitin-protein ligase E3 Mdm2 [Lissonota sp. PSUC_FEM 10030012]
MSLERRSSNDLSSNNSRSTYKQWDSGVSNTSDGSSRRDYNSGSSTLNQNKSKGDVNFSKGHQRKRSITSSLDAEKVIFGNERIKEPRMDPIPERDEEIHEPGSNDVLPDEDIEPVEMCRVCGERPKNGGFLHKKEVHISRCFECAKLFWQKSNKKCPCGFSSSMVVKIRLN